MHAIESVCNDFAAEISRQPWEVAGITVAYLAVVGVVIYGIDRRWRRRNRRPEPEPYRASSEPLTVPDIPRQVIPGWVEPSSPVRDLETAWAVPEEEIDALIELCLEWGEPGG